MSQRAEMLEGMLELCAAQARIYRLRKACDNALHIINMDQLIKSLENPEGLAKNQFRIGDFLVTDLSDVRNNKA